MATREYNLDLDIKGSISATTVPNSTGSVVTWNSSTNVFGLRSNAQIISDLGLTSVVNNSHTHNNKSVLDGITSTNVNDWNTAFGWGDFRDYGLGVDSSPLIGSQDWNDKTVNAWHSSHLSSTNVPAGLSPFISGMSFMYDVNNGWQLLSGRQSNQDIYYRKVQNGTFTDWFQLYSTRNFDIADYATETWVTQQINNISIPTVNDGQLTLSTGTGLSGSANFTANQSGNSSFSVGIASTHKLPTTAEWNALPTTNTITRLRGTATGTYTSGDLTLLAGNNVSISQSGSNFTINATDTNTTYSAGIGLSLTGTTFGQKITTSGTGSFVTGITQTTNGFQVNLGTPPNTTYSNMTIAELNAETVTTGRIISASVLGQWLNAKGFSTQTLTAGSNISIVGNVISATNTTYTGSNGIDLVGTDFRLSSGTLSDIQLGVTAHGWGNFRDYGLGANSIANNDWDSITETGFYRNSTSSTIGIPIQATNISLYHLNQHSTAATQMAIRTGSDQMWFRRKTGRVWQPWVELYHTGNFNPALYLPLSGGTMTGNIALNSTWNQPSLIKDTTGTGNPTYGFSLLRGKNANADKGLGITNQGDLVYGDWSNVTNLSSQWYKIYHTGNLTNLSQLTNDVGFVTTDTTYSAGTLALLQAGTNTSNRVWSAKILAEYVTSMIPTTSDGILSYSSADGIVVTDWNSFALSEYAMSLGYGSVTSGNYATSVGGLLSTTGFGSTNQGYSNSITKSLGYALGAYNSVRATLSGAFGIGLINRNDGAFVIGRYNSELPIEPYDTTSPHKQAVFAIGAGRDDTDRYTAVTVYGDGRADYAHGYDDSTWTNNTLVTKKWVQDNAGGSSIGGLAGYRNVSEASVFDLSVEYNPSVAENVYNIRTGAPVVFIGGAEVFPDGYKVTVMTTDDRVDVSFDNTQAVRFVDAEGIYVSYIDGYRSYTFIYDKEYSLFRLYHESFISLN